MTSNSKTSEKKQIDTELYDFFGVKRFPFDTTPLFPPDDKLFVDRERELKRMALCVRQGKNCAVVGGQGPSASLRP